MSDTVALSSVAKVQSGFAFKSRDWADAGIPVVKIQNVRDGSVDLDGCSFVTREVAQSASRYRISRGDVLITMSGEIGSVGVVRTDQHLMLNQRVGRITLTSDSVDARFLGFALQHPDLKRQMESIAYGVAQPNISPSLIESLSIWLPSLDVQRVLADRLQELDHLIENNRRRIEILEEMARLLYREWFVHFRFPGHEDVELIDSELGPIPEGWEVVNLASCCGQLQAGGTPKRKETAFWDSHDLDWYKTGELQDDFLFGSVEGISALAAESARTFEPGTILMAIYGSPTVGRLGVLTTRASCNQAALALVAHPGRATQTFLYYKLWELRAMFNSIAQGAAQQNISKEKVASARIALPPMPLIRRFDDQSTPLWSLRENLGRQNRILREARDLLLPRLVSGELDVSDLDLESVLT